MVAWADVFAPSMPLAEIVARGSAMYVGLFGLMRLVRRQSGAMSVADLLLVVLIADAAQNGMAGNGKSVADGLLLVSTILFWSYFLDWLGYRVPWVGRMVHPQPVPLVKDGKILRKNLRQELITTDELMSQLREQGVADVADAKAAHLEGDGKISVIRRDDGDGGGRNDPPAGTAG